LTVGEDLLTQDLAVAGVLGELAEDLQLNARCGSRRASWHAARRGADTRIFDSAQARQEAPDGVRDRQQLRGALSWTTGYD
jgi:hypothetical protein